MKAQVLLRMKCSSCQLLRKQTLGTCQFYNLKKFKIFYISFDYSSSVASDLYKNVQQNLQIKTSKINYTITRCSQRCEKKKQEFLFIASENTTVQPLWKSLPVSYKTEDTFYYLTAVSNILNLLQSYTLDRN